MLLAELSAHAEGLRSDDYWDAAAGTWDLTALREDVRLQRRELARASASAETRGTGQKADGRPFERQPTDRSARVAERLVRAAVPAVADRFRNRCRSRSPVDSWHDSSSSSDASSSSSSSSAVSSGGGAATRRKAKPPGPGCAPESAYPVFAPSGTKASAGASDARVTYRARVQGGHPRGGGAVINQGLEVFETSLDIFSVFHRKEADRVAVVDAFTTPIRVEGTCEAPARGAKPGRMGEPEDYSTAELIQLLMKPAQAGKLHEAAKYMRRHAGQVSLFNKRVPRDVGHRLASIVGAACDRLRAGAAGAPAPSSRGDASASVRMEWDLVDEEELLKDT